MARGLILLVQGRDAFFCLEDGEGELTNNLHIVTLSYMVALCDS
jgi:hypothetical protein